MQEPVLRIAGFSKTYGPTHDQAQGPRKPRGLKGGALGGVKKAVDDLSLEVAAGSIFGFIGHNGAGKTTTLRAVAGIIDFDGGDIFIDGHSIREEPIRCKSLCAYIPDNPDLYEYLTGMQYLNFIADIFRIPREDRKARIFPLGERFELNPSLGALISTYSHGMKQKLALMSAFIHQPRLLILDEPFVGLDPQAAFRLKELMGQLCASGGSVFFSTHILEVAEKLCDTIGIIKGGKLAALGPLDTVRGDRSLERVFLDLVEGTGNRG